MAQDKEIYIPPTISDQAKEFLRSLIEAKTYALEFPGPEDVAGWEKVYAAAEAFNKEKAEKALAASGATVTEVEMGGVTVEDIRPHGWTDNGKVLVYVHGGGTACSAPARPSPMLRPWPRPRVFGSFRSTTPPRRARTSRRSSSRSCRCSTR